MLGVTVSVVLNTSVSGVLDRENESRRFLSSRSRELRLGGPTTPLIYLVGLNHGDLGVLN